MRLRHSALAIILAVSLVQCGCASLNPWAESERKEAGLEKPEHTGGYAWNKDEEDPYGFVGKESGRSLEKDPDPWFKQMFYSGKARNIERNLGLE